MSAYSSMIVLANFSRVSLLFKNQQIMDLHRTATSFPIPHKLENEELLRFPAKNSEYS